MERWIFHVDMDAFYASVEQRDNPAYGSKPVIVGADPRGGRGRGVVAACSYEARKFGIHSAMPISQAFRLCPQGVFLRPDIPRYLEVSREIRRLFLAATPLVEPLSIDEAFLDVTGRAEDEAGILDLARSLKARIREEQALTASVGAGPSKFIAKIASDLSKPDGLVIVRAEDTRKFLDPLPTSRIWGVGPKTEGKLRSMNVRTIGQLRVLAEDLLVRRFGRHGSQLWKLANGIDDRQVQTERPVKSVSQERTFPEDTNEAEQLLATLDRLSRKVSERLRKHHLRGRTVAIKVRYSDFTTWSRQSSFRESIDDGIQIFEIGRALLLQHWRRERKIRLIGVGLAGLEPVVGQRQLQLFGPRSE